MAWKISYTILCVVITSYYRGHWDVIQLTKVTLSKCGSKFQKLNLLTLQYPFPIFHFWFKGDVFPNEIILKVELFLTVLMGLTLCLSLCKKKFLSSSNSCSKLKCQNMNILHVPRCFPLRKSYNTYCTLNLKMSLYKLCII